MMCWAAPPPASSTRSTASTASSTTSPASRRGRSSGNDLRLVRRFRTVTILNSKPDWRRGMRQDYRAWLEKQKYDSRTIGTQCSRINRVEENYGDLAEFLAAGRLQSVLTAFQYSAEDKRRNRPNPSTLQINGDLSSNLASYKNSVALYRRFLEEVRGAPEPSAPIDGGIAR